MPKKVFQVADEIREFLQLYSVNTYNNAVIEKRDRER
jgi:hypothetical protein